MPTSATGNRPLSEAAPARAGTRCRRQSGFTLVEIMVVLVLVALMSAVVVIALPEPGGGVRHEAERFAARALAVRDTAIGQGRSGAIRIDAQGYAVERRAGGRWVEGERVRWTPGLGVAAPVPRIPFDATGMTATPTSVALTRGEAVVRVVFPEDGAVHVAR
jgi:general secretion pathway protein H